MDLLSAWNQCDKDQFIVRETLPDWGVTKEKTFIKTVSAASSFGIEFAQADDWIISDEKPVILGKAQKQSSVKLSPEFVRTGWWIL